jgi:hypothetical protein
MRCRPQDMHSGPGGWSGHFQAQFGAEQADVDEIVVIVFSRIQTRLQIPTACSQIVHFKTSKFKALMQ